MEWILAAWILGIAGSLHCAGMCGPLMIALPVDKSVRSRWIQQRLINQSGRILMYGIMGLVVGLLGEKLALAGWQRWTAITAGFILLFFTLWPSRTAFFTRGPFRLIGKLKSLFSSLLQRKGNWTLFLLGVLNGLLPCGLVYIALASSMALGDSMKGAGFMVFFGLGTAPMLLAITGIGKWIRERLQFRTYRTMQIILTASAFLILLRGANLGIPYLSPSIDVEKEQVDCCHRPGH